MNLDVRLNDRYSKKYFNLTCRTTGYLEVAGVPMEDTNRKSIADILIGKYR